MSRTIALVMSLVVAGFIAVIGISYIAAPQAIAPSFGFRGWPSDNGFLVVKGVRDLFCGIIIVALLALRQRRALAIVMAAATMIPAGDAINVLFHNGSVATALGMHLATAGFVLATAIVLWRAESVGQPALADSNKDPS